MVRVLSAALATVAMATGLSACGGPNTLTVCTSIPYEPFQYKDSWKDNKIVGFDVDMMDLVAKKLGAQQKIVDSGFDSIDSGSVLEDGDCDVAAAALSITPDRQKKMSFSQPYYYADQALAAKKDSKLKNLKGLKGKKLGVQRDTTGAAYAEENQDKYGYKIRPYNNLDQLREALIYDVVDAAINDVPLWTSKVDKAPEPLRIIQRYDTGEKYGYAVSKDNADLLKTINAVLDEAKKDGQYDKICKKWIGEKCASGNDSGDGG
jgi:polar amino acid transport system substrate-binding protein